MKLKRQLVVFSVPNLKQISICHFKTSLDFTLIYNQAFVVASQVEKEVLVDCISATSHCRKLIIIARFLLQMNKLSEKSRQ